MTTTSIGISWSSTGSASMTSGVIDTRGPRWSNAQRGEPAMITRRDVATGLAGFMLHAGAGPWSSAQAAVPGGKADRIVVAKGDRRLFRMTLIASPVPEEERGKGWTELSPLLAEVLPPPPLTKVGVTSRPPLPIAA